MFYFGPIAQRTSESIVCLGIGGGVLVDYLSELTASNLELSAQVMESFGSADIRGVALSYVENSGISRTKAIPLSKLESALVGGVGMSPVFDAFLLDDSITSSDVSGGPMGDLRLFPDLSSASILPNEGWGWIPVNRFRQDRSPHPLDHRLFATKMVDRLRSMGISSKMSFEIEWILSSNTDGGFEPATVGPAYGLERIVELGDYLLEILDALEAAGIKVEQIHPEYAAGQFEVSVAPTSPVVAADQSVLMKHVIRTVSHNYGLRASFAPSVVAGGVGNGGHVHFSFSEGEEYLFGSGPDQRYGLTGRGESILAGVLSELDALSAIGTPTVASYLRLVPQHWAGAFKCWGVENREAALRLVRSGPLVPPTAANAEIKSFDLAASPYLVVGSVLAIAAASVDKGLTLTNPIDTDPALLDGAALAAAGVVRMPTNLRAALDALSHSDVIRTAMGSELYTAFVAVRDAELATYGALEPDEIVAASRWKY